MCGVFGYVGPKNEAPTMVLDGLKKLEYRGYDSWGIASRVNGQVPAHIVVEKHVGKIGLAHTSLAASDLALGHTRWATHGRVTQENAHPHLDCTGRLAVIHNGIVENHAELKHELCERGHTFHSETDTEVIAHLMEEEVAGDGETQDGVTLVQALMRAFRRLEGLSAVGVMDARLRCIAAAKNGSPLVLGWADDGSYVASDSSALLAHTRRLTFLDDCQAALLTDEGITVFDITSGEPIENPKVWDIEWQEEAAELNGYANFMDKEVHEQPVILRRIAEERADEAAALANLVAESRDVHFIGCGSAGHAGKAAEYIFSRIAHKQVSFAVGSEFGYLEDFLGADSLVVGLSQSGETIDLLDSMKAAKKRGASLAALVNVEGSSLYRMVDCPILLNAGPERCVLATKSFTAKLAVLLMAAYAMRGEAEKGRALVERAAAEIQTFLTDGRAEQVRRVAEQVYQKENLYVIGRGVNYPLALEAALKIKEVSYMHAEGFAGGELKHGVIALIEPGTPCLVLAPKDETFRSIVSGAQEIKARGGVIIGISPEPADVWDIHIPIADVGEGSAIVNAVPPQVLAYHVALLRGLDPDKPRNLAKSVTVK